MDYDAYFTEPAVERTYPITRSHEIDTRTLLSYALLDTQLRAWKSIWSSCQIVFGQVKRFIMDASIGDRTRDILYVATAQHDPEKLGQSTMFRPYSHYNSMSPKLGRTIDHRQQTSPRRFLAGRWSRRAACTHLRTERFYGKTECRLCHLPGGFGWVYKCIQDQTDICPCEGMEHGVSSTKVVPSHTSAPLVQVSCYGSESFDLRQNDNTSMALSQSQRGIDHSKIPRLSFRVERDISRGLYTSSQVDILRKQRQVVLDSINQTIASNKSQVTPHIFRPSLYPSSQGGAYPQISKQATSGSSVSLLDTEDDSVSESRSTMVDLEDDIGLFSPETARGGDTKTNVSSSFRADSIRVHGFCDYSVCHNCAWTYQDRAWLRIEDVMATPVPITTQSPLWTLDTGEGRPQISSVTMMRSIGLSQVADRSSAASISSPTSVQLQRSRPLGTIDLKDPDHDAGENEADISDQRPDTGPDTESSTESVHAFFVQRLKRGARKGNDSGQKPERNFVPVTIENGESSEDMGSLDASEVWHDYERKRFGGKKFGKDSMKKSLRRKRGNGNLAVRKVVHVGDDSANHCHMHDILWQDDGTIEQVTAGQSFHSDGT